MIANCENIYVMTFSKLLKLTDFPITNRKSIIIIIVIIIIIIIISSSSSSSS